MNEQLNKLKEIQAKTQKIANRIDVNCEDSEKQYQELMELSNELGLVINEVGTQS